MATLQVFPGTLIARLYLAKRDREQNIPRVVLATYHAAKGLEWEHVFLIDLNHGLIPRPEIEHAEVEEERRTLYVAITRAREGLYLYCSDTPSEFLVETNLLVDATPETYMERETCG